jgi:predicted acetyltransferase
MGIEIRVADPSEYASAIDTMSTAFVERPDIEKVAASIQRTWEPGRLVAAFDAGRAVGTFRAFSTELTVPGLAALPGAGISAVGVKPTHRRQGLLGRMASAAHADIAARGEVAAVLYASEYPIYGRFGYGPATRWADWVVDVRLAAFRDPVPGGVDLVTPDAAAVETIRAIHEQVRRSRAGEIRRLATGWPFRLGLEEEPWGETWKGFLVVRRDASGTPDGYARYTGKPKWEHHLPTNGVEVQELVAASDEAYRALWGFLLALDLVTNVQAGGLRVDEPLPWMLRNARAARSDGSGDALWVRLFDVPRALEARTYERTGSLVIEVVDDEAFGGRRRYLLDASEGGARCTPTSREADLTLPVAALGAAYLGGTRLRDAVLGTGCDEHRDGALAQADALLRTADPPYCSTFF